MKELFFDCDELPDFFSGDRLSGDGLFVFSTDVVKDSWIDWIVSHPERTGKSAIPLDRFIAWDKFKGGFASSRDKDSGRGTVPALLRKLFVRSLISRNKKERLFKSLIVPGYADDALSFTDWMASMLPSLGFWHKSYEDYLRKRGMDESDDKDSENRDLRFLYKEYSAFLASQNLYEPSWIEPDFTGRSEYYLIYPELLEDFSDYGAAFLNAPNITAVHLRPLADGEGRADCYCYADSREELRKTLLRVRKLVGEKKARWQDISISVPKMDIYRPYIEREAEKYCVPVVIHAGESLLKSSAAAVFGKLYECYSSRFSYNSVRALLLDAHIPWKKDSLKLIENLVREGCQMHCVCQYDDAHDIWEESLSATRERNERELRFYRSLKKNITALCKADSFSHILSAWMIFKKDLLDTNDFSPAANLILGRCVEELKKLVLIWQEYGERSGLSLENPYEFFLTELKGTKYTMQNKSAGVQVYPYRLSAGAAFPFQFVLDASQSQLELPVRRLPFLSMAKRKDLGLLEREKQENPSVAFIRLYAGLNGGLHGEGGVAAFSFAENSFSGFAIAHSFLHPIAADGCEDLAGGDFIAQERAFFLAGGARFPFSGKMQSEALRWLAVRKPLPELSQPEAFPERIRSLLLRRSRSSEDGRMRISQSDLKSFFPCPRRWLYGRLFNLDDDSLSGELSGPFDLGNINHKVLELFMKHCLKERGGRLPMTLADGSFGKDEEAMYDLLCQLAKESIEDPSMSFRNSRLSKLTFASQKEAVASSVLNCLHAICRPEDDKKLSFGGYEVYAAEDNYCAEGDGGKWVYNGKIDCILKDRQGNLAILDYKSGGTPSAKDCIADADGMLADFQMPMYLKLCDSRTGAAVQTAVFYSIRGAAATVVMQPKEKKKGRSGSVDREEFEATLGAFEGYATRFYERLQACVLVPSSDKGDGYNYVDSYEDCASCAFKTVCRTAFRVAGRKLPHRGAYGKETAR